MNAKVKRKYIEKVVVAVEFPPENETDSKEALRLADRAMSEMGHDVDFYNVELLPGSEYWLVNVEYSREVER